MWIESALGHSFLACDPLWYCSPIETSDTELRVAKGFIFEVSSYSLRAPSPSTSENDSAIRASDSIRNSLRSALREKKNSNFKFNYVHDLAAHFDIL